MAVTYPSIITPGQQRIFFAQEGVWGVAPNSSNQAATVVPGSGIAYSSMVFLEPCQAITSAIQRQPYEAREYTGVPADLFDEIETTHHTTITITTPFRANGIAGWALAALAGSTQGGGTDSVSGATSPFSNCVHTLTPNNLSNNVNTLTVWHDQGDAAFTSGTRSMLQMSAATVESVRLTFTPNTALMAEITMQALFPKWRSTTSSSGNTGYNPPAGTITKLGSDTTYDATRMMGFQAQTFNIMSSTGVKYPNKILSGDITITRQNEIIESPFSQDPTYFLPGPIAATGTVSFLYDGLGDINYGSAAGNPSTIMQDYLNFANAGNLANQHQITYVDTKGNGFGLNFYPIKWTSFTLNTSAQSLKADAGFTSFNALADAQGTPTRISAIRSLTLGNNISFAQVI